MFAPASQAREALAAFMPVFFQVSHAKVRPFEICLVERSPAEVSFGEIGLRQIRPLEIGVFEIGFGQIDGKLRMLSAHGVPPGDALLEKLQLTAVIGIGNGRGEERKREDESRKGLATDFHGTAWKCLDES